ncbi:membrane protein [Marmoricola endophyticus]|uniref:Membrane protein n=1 Tax=Marmoricola endophyticus TaxID=2040280 RepID=A0A917F3U1_9ACTN|nr:VTT domain-containing protein [Marmoricola endophyticus]GGF42715.1 membrane protein [Marmoricola endophyticus]
MTPDLGFLGLLALTGVVLFGAVVPIVPTGAAVAASAVLARAEHPWELVLVVGFGGLGAYLGDLVMYAILRAAGAPLAQRIGWLHADDPDGALQRLRHGIEEHEVRSLLLSRLIPAGRIPVLLAAALGGYPWGRFVTANIGAALLWAVMYSLIGILGNTIIPDTRLALGAVVLVAVLVSVVLPRLTPKR